MSKSIFSTPQFNDEAAAYAFVEAQLWPDGPVCPHCGVIGKAGRLQGKSNRPGLWKCYACRKPFTVKVGTIFEDSHIAMRDWLTAIHLICSSKKGISANQLSRTLGITLKSAWFMAHRIREAFKPDRRQAPFGSEGGFVEMDETYYGNKADRPKNEPGVGHKHAVMALVERGGRIRSLYMPVMQKQDAHDVVRHHVSPKAHLRTDESMLYFGIENWVASHATVNHSADEYVRGDASTNTIEGAFGLFKRGMIGTYQHCGVQHLQRYLNEFDFRYSNRAKLGVDDETRAMKALKGAAGKRLTYRTTRGQEARA
ncbi:MAG: IS1595 family transposase [Alphaproteobacteria bacterium]|nr:IS1595 family transposase [Alphaproteobacteria bacterium]